MGSSGRSGLVLVSFVVVLVADVLFAHFFVIHH